MSETEEPPMKLSKVDNEDEAAMSDTTDASLVDTELPETLDLPELTNMPEVTNSKAPDMPEVALPETTDMPEVALPETTDMPEATIPVTDMPEATNMPVTDMPEVAMPEPAETLGVTESNNPKGTETTDDIESALEDMTGTEMVEERLQDSLESLEEQDGQGHEEWLSEGILTDDDYNPNAERSDSQDSQHSTKNLTNGTAQPVQVNEDLNSTETRTKPAEQNIEDALNSLEGGPEKKLPGSLDEFLIKKTDTNNVNTAESKAEQDDGNDTDDLLRMLGEDGTKGKKKLTKTVKDIRSGAKAELSSSDDEFIFEGSSKKLKLAKTVIKKMPAKAVPENTKDSESDEAATMQKMFSSNSKTAKPKFKTKMATTRQSSKKDKLVTSTPLPNKLRSLLKPVQTTPRTVAQLRTTYKSVEVKKEANPNTYSRKGTKPTPPAPVNSSKKEVVKKEIIKKVVINKEVKEEVDEGGSMDEDYQFKEDLDDFDDDSIKGRRVSGMRPEHMDEDAFSDGESHSEDGSLYDELPSSDSEGVDDWFQLDIRAEKAGDYLPLLGSNAKQALLEEKRRVANRLASLKQSLTALTESGKKQAEQVRTATLALAELDDMLKTS